MSLRRTSSSENLAQKSLPPTLRQGVWLSALLWWLSGVGASTFAFGWIALVPLLWSIDNQSAQTRFRSGWKCGFLTFALVNWWIVLAVTRGAHMIGVPSLLGTLLGVLGVVVIASVHGSGVALVALLWNPSSTRWRRLPLFLPLAVAAIWTLFDYMRCEGVLAHSWGAPAFSQTGDLALLQIASVVGQHGLSFFCVWIAASIASWLHSASDFRLNRKSVWAIPFLIFLALHGWGFWRLSNGIQISGEAKTLRVLLIQTSASSGAGKMQSAFRQAYAETYTAVKSATAKSATFKPQLVVWPETTFHIDRLSSEKERNEYSIGRDIDSLELRQLLSLCREFRFSILCGADVVSHSRIGVETRSNEAFLISPDGVVQKSAKTHLVPFGEQAPFTAWLPWLQNFAPQPAMTAGNSQLLRVKNADVPLGALICFESCFSAPARELRRQGAQALFVLTNDEWFGGSEAPAQHAQMSRVRAVENDTWVAQSANGGYTFAIDPHGRFFSQSRYGKPQALQVEVTLSLN